MANDVIITIKGVDKASKVIGGVEKKAGGLGSALKKVGTVAGGFLAASVISGGVQKLTGFLTDSIAKAKEQLAVEAQLEAVLKSTGGAAGVMADDVKNLARELQKTTNFGDETTIAAQNMLLTFTGIGKDVFPEATKAALDMATALGTSAVDASKMLGMALNDPVQGISRLTRSGIVFTEEQKEQIKTMSEAGDIAGAQAIMMAELNKEFGGSAEAAVLADGGMQQAENATGDLQEKIGMKLIPVMVVWKKIQLAILNFMVNKFAPFIKKLADKYLPPLKKAFTDIKNAIQPLIDKVVPLFEKLSKNKSVLTAVAAIVGVALVAAFVALGIAAAGAAIGVLLALAPFIAIVAAVALVSVGLYLLVTHFDDIKKKIVEIVIGLKDKVVEAFNSVIDWVKSNWPLLLAILAGPFGLAVYAIIKNKDEILEVISGLKNKVVEIFNSIKDKIVGAFNTAKDKVGEIMTGVKDKVVNGFNRIIEHIEGLPGRFERGMGKIGTAMKNGIRGGINAVIGLLNKFLDNIGWSSKKFMGATVLPSFNPFGASTIPTLDTGGLVVKTGLAEVHKGETFSGVGKAGGGLTVNLYVEGSILSEENLTEIIADAIRGGGFRGFVD